MATSRSNSAMTMWLAQPLLAAVLALTAAASAVVAQDQPARRERTEQPVRTDPQPGTGGVLRLLPGDVSRELTIAVAGRPLTYIATAGTLPIYDQNGERSAAVFYTAYVAKGGDASRPLTFVFNGGPGAASAYLHIGLAGPRIVEFG